LLETRRVTAGLHRASGFCAITPTTLAYPSLMLKQIVYLADSNAIPHKNSFTVARG
jgi:hypothetical protein